MQILSFSIAVPYEGIAHAGGEYYLRHIRALLALGHQVTVVAPRSPQNEQAARMRELPIRVLLIGERRVMPRLVDVVAERLRPALPAPAYRRGVRGSRRIEALVREADLIEFQWTQTAGLRRMTSRFNNSPSIVVAHDVMTQSLHRDALQPGITPLRRSLRWVKYWLARRDERRVLRGSSRIVVFSEKDSALIDRVAPTVPVSVLPPPLEPTSPDWRGNTPSDRDQVLFVGAFDRNENAEAAEWFVQEIWPQIRLSVAGAHLVLAGGSPTEIMLALAARDPSIRVTGYVEDLDALYRSAAVVVVPLQNGAGVKFKTVTAMLWGLPVVTTSVGAEGIGTAEDGLFAAVEDNAEHFAAAVIRVLHDPDRSSIERRAARGFAEEAYGNERFFSELAELLRITN